MTEESTEPTSRLHTVMFVDDEEPLLVAFKRVCRNTGWKIITASSGREGIDYLTTEPVDIIVSDMKMPEMDGAEFLERASKMSPQSVRILLTGYADIESTVAAINQGKIYSYLSKPWDNDELKETIKKALYVKELEQEKDRLNALAQQKNDELQELNDSLEDKVLTRTKQLQKLYYKLKESYASIVEVFANVIGIRSEDISAHSQRVANIARKIAEILKLSKETTEQIYFAGLLHDIGKIGMLDQFIRLPYDKVPKKQQLEYENHSIIGEAALMTISPLKEAAKYIRHHHENYDGSGFPDRLIQDEIPLGAQIIGIASYYDELASSMGEAEVLPEKEIRALLRAKAGSWFDEKLVQTFIDQLNAGLFSDIKAADRLLTSDDLLVGMTLSRDVKTPDGRMLLSKNKKLDTELIEKITGFQNDTDGMLSIYILNEDIPEDEIIR